MGHSRANSSHESVTGKSESRVSKGLESESSLKSVKGESES